DEPLLRRGPAASSRPASSTSIESARDVALAEMQMTCQTCSRAKSAFSVGTYKIDSVRSVDVMTQCFAHCHEHDAHFSRRASAPRKNPLRPPSGMPATLAYGL